MERDTTATTAGSFRLHLACRQTERFIFTLTDYISNFNKSTEPYNERAHNSAKIIQDSILMAKKNKLKKAFNITESSLFFYNSLIKPPNDRNNHKPNTKWQ